MDLTRIQSEIAGKKYDKTIGFGDTDGDKEMLNWVDEQQFKFFH